MKQELSDSGMLKELYPGQYVLLPKGTRLLAKVNSLLDRYRLREFQEVVLPKTVPKEVLQRAGVLGKWDSYILSVKPVSETKGVAEEHLLDPLQCISFYQCHADSVIDIGLQPICWFDRSGPTYRNEDLHRLEPLVKQREFHRAELIYLGTRKQVSGIRERSLTRLVQLCYDLRIEYRVVEGEGCFEMGAEEKRTLGQDGTIPIQDLEVLIPQEDRWLELAGCAVFADTMTKRFNIKGTDGHYLWSGCTGIGLNRMMYALISYYGTDESAYMDLPRVNMPWPEK